MKQFASILLILISAALTIWTCETPRAYPIIPVVKFKSVSIEDTIDHPDLRNPIKRILLTISVEDGDGDIGIMYEDNGSVYEGFEDLGNKNLFITLYEKVNGEFVEVELLAPHYYGTRFLEPEGQDKTLKADFEVKIDYADTLITWDTIKYSFYIYDRAKNISNTAETPEFAIDTVGIIE